ncbi:MAG: hypothetical protein WCW84_10045 [Sulfurimonas sp.]|jgi:hypothetical protein
MKILYTPIQRMTNTFNDAPVLQLRKQKGDTALLFFSGTLMTFWSGEGMIIDDDTNMDEIATYDAIKHGFDIDMAKYVMRMMVKNGYLATRPYSEELDGKPQYQERLDCGNDGKITVIREEAVNGEFSLSA